MAIGAPASAEIVQIYASGVVSNGQDITGLLGNAGEDLSNVPFSFSATFNLNNAGYDNYGDRSDIYGGAGYSYLPVQPPSLGGGTLTIGGVTQTLQGNWNTSLSASIGPNSSDTQFVQDYVDDGVTSLNNAVYLTETPGFGLFTLHYIPPAGNLCLVAACGGGFSFDESVNGNVVYAAYGNLAPSIVTITATGVPEPMTWALMILGLAMIGFVARRRSEGLIVGA